MAGPRQRPAFVVKPLTIIRMPNNIVDWREPSTLRTQEPTETTGQSIDVYSHKNRVRDIEVDRREAPNPSRDREGAFVSGLGSKNAPSRSRLGLAYCYARILSIGRPFRRGIHKNTPGAPTPPMPHNDE